ncbi:hypothetical protein [Psychrobacter sp. 72-O-c]|nr:hypothetical protein [Psychrobacter sp. 72-O-c]
MNFHPLHTHYAMAVCYFYLSHIS